MKTIIATSLALIAFTFMGCEKSEKEKCKDQTNKTWNEETEKCEDTGLPKTKEQCEAKEGYTWDETNSKCTPPSAKGAITKEQCEKDTTKQWNEAEKKCENKTQEEMYTITNRIPVRSRQIVIMSDNASKSLAKDQCVQVAESQFATLKITYSTKDGVVMCNNADSRSSWSSNTCGNKGHKKVKLKPGVVGAQIEEDAKNETCPDKLEGDMAQ